MWSDIAQLKAIVKHNHVVVESILADIVKEDGHAKKSTLVNQALSLIGGWSGHYSSHILEQFFLDLATQYPLPSPLPKYKKNTVLHVMTEAYATGGHTRVVERWIALDGVRRKQSLLLTENAGQLPTLLQEVIEGADGQIYRLNDDLNPIEKGLSLRKIAAEYEYIVLHQHDHDVVPLLAFGHVEFTRPVFLFNHAEFRFTMGFSIADKVLTLSAWPSSLAQSVRGISNIDHIPLLYDSAYEPDKIAIDILREQLGLPVDKKIIVTAASAYKYKKIGTQSILGIAKEIFDAIPDVLLLVIGPDSGFFTDAKRILGRYHKQFFTLGLVSPDKLYQAFCAADLVVDSMPLGGGATMIDAMYCNKPILSLKGAVGQLDYLVNSEAYCQTPAAFIEKAVAILSSQEEALRNIQNVQASYAKYEYASQEQWLEKLDSIYSSVDSHAIRQFTTPKKNTISDLDALNARHALKVNFSLKLSSLLYIGIYENSVCRYLQISLAQKNLYSKIISKNRSGVHRYGVPYIFELVKKTQYWPFCKRKSIKVLGIDLITYEKRGAKRQYTVLGKIICS